MADLSVGERQLTIRLDWWEKLAAHRSDLTVPLRAVTSVTAVADVFAQPGVVGGHRDQATRIPGLTATGTLETVGDVPREVGGVIFAACHGARPSPGIVIELNGCTVDRIVMSSDAPDEDAALLRRGSRPGGRD